MKNIHQTKIYFDEEINQKELVSKKHNKIFAARNYIDLFLILTSVATGCISISIFASRVGISIGITSSAAGFCERFVQ